MILSDYRSGLEDWLSQEDIDTYLNLIQLDRCPPTLNTLRQIIRRTYEIVPFQNLTMLTRPRRPPTLEQIRDDMLSGVGGLCTTINPFLCAFLQSLGFRAGLLAVSMSQPNCHMGIIVRNLESKDYWLDLGNGFPYLEPLPIEEGATYTALNFTYQLQKTDNHWQLLQSVLGSSAKKINQQFKADPCHYDEFASMRMRHYTQPDYGPFLSGIRVNRWTEEIGYLLRDDILWVLPGKPVKASASAAREWLIENFECSSILLPLLNKSWSNIIERPKN